MSDNSTGSGISNPTITTTTDWLGSIVRYQDALGAVPISVYDQAGRTTSMTISNGSGTVACTYTYRSDAAWPTSG